MTITNKFAAAAAAQAAVTDMTVATKGGGDIPPLAAGPCRLRFMGYIEIGLQPGTYLGKPTKKDKVKLIFEVSGPKHPPREHEGVKYPNLITVEENYSTNEKARFYKLFGLLNHAGTAKVAAELLGNAYKGTIIHRKFAKKGEPKDDASKWTGLAVELYNKKTGAYTIEPPRYELVNPEDHENPGPTGEMRELKVDAPLSDLRCFLWDFPDMEQWQSIFIDGMYEERKDDKGNVTKPAASKNVHQNAIKAALNFKDSPIAVLLANNGVSLDLNPNDVPEQDEDEGAGDHEVPKATAPGGADDPLAGVA